MKKVPSIMRLFLTLSVALLAGACTGKDLETAASQDEGGGGGATLGAQTFVPNLNDCFEVETGVAGGDYKETYAAFLFGGESLSFAIGDGFTVQPIQIPGIAAESAPAAGDGFVAVGQAAQATTFVAPAEGWYGFVVSGNGGPYSLSLALACAQP